MTKYQKCGSCGAAIKVVRISTGAEGGFGQFEWEIFDDDSSGMPHICGNQPNQFRDPKDSE